MKHTALLKNRNLWVIAAVIVLSLVLLLVGMNVKTIHKPVAPAASLTISGLPTFAPLPNEMKTTAPHSGGSAGAPEGAEEADEDAASETDIDWTQCMFLVVTTSQGTYYPIPLTEELSFTLQQDENTINVIHITPDSVCMESSTCENQDCVQQGVVDRENREQRILGNFIVCLPNQVQLELVDFQEAAYIVAQLSSYGQ